MGARRSDAAASQSVSLRERRRLQTRNDLLAAATAVFRARGYRGATVDEIASTAGASRGTFYAHFKDKGEIAVEIGTSCLPDFAAEFRRLAALPDPTPAAVAQWLSAFIVVFDSHITAFAVGMEASTADSTFSVIDARLFDEQASWMAAYFDRLPEAEREPARMRVMLLQLQLMFALYQWRVRQIDFDQAHLVDALAQLWSRELSRE